MAEEEKESVGYDKSLLFGEMENPFSEIEQPEAEKKETPILENAKENHIEKPFKGELTLDEPLKETIKRDVMTIYGKLRFILNFRQNENDVKELKNWDLWGPFVLCFLLAIS